LHFAIECETFNIPGQFLSERGRARQNPGRVAPYPKMTSGHNQNRTVQVSFSPLCTLQLKCAVVHRLACWLTHLALHWTIRLMTNRLLTITLTLVH